MVSNLGAILAYLYPSADPRRDYRVQDSGDGTGPQLVSWNQATLGAPPTADQVAAAQLPVAQAAKVAAIDARTMEIIARGFVFDNVSFGLSAVDQLNWTAMLAGQSQGLLTYPLDVTTAGNVGYAVADAATLARFTGTAIGTAKAAYDSGRDLKAQVMTATTVDAANAVQDTRA